MKTKTKFLLLLLLVAITMTGCFSQSVVVNNNHVVDSSNFKIERKITVYNARTDTIILTAEGLMNISNNSQKELVCTIKTGEDTYKKHLIYLNEYTLYVVEDITGTRTDPYSYKIYFHVNDLDIETK